ncbi:DUF58 domain-containing protein [Homoserinibacter sp. YIM 151385]|uniref:DUF58 domain-containing protein n=1 Tax=Homoserinibacter sp. YIM 151385 TaxID=2985506 RepID=UPI0022EFF568|nr:DUF58 domain-containing protein [Homoserinibacter sp. YIM 151385]WBU39229.1 DUF58 domain-containing protein [Homoserinibacter sp. YIM 151385]
MIARLTALWNRARPGILRVLVSLRELLAPLGKTIWRGLRVLAYLVLAGWRIVQPVLAVVSGIGWLVLVAGTASLVAGLVLGWQELVFLGATLVGGLLVAAIFIIGRASFRVGIELTPRRVTAGERALGRFTVQSTAPRRTAPSRFELPVGQGLAEFIVPPLEPEAEHEELFAVPTQRRAVIVAGPAVSVRGDQLGLFRRTVRWSDPVELFVHPQIARLEPSAAGLVRDIEGAVSKTVTNDDISFHALRSYEPGDALRSVHWRTSARTGQLMVKQFEETRRSQVVLLFSTDRRHYADEAEFELAVSVLASLGIRIIGDSTPADVIAEDLSLRVHTPTTLLDDTCRLELGSSRHGSLREYARDATRRLPRPSLAMVVGGSGITSRDLRGVEQFFGPDTQTVGFRAELGQPARLNYVKALRIVTLGQLSDLPRLIRRIL